MIQYKNSIFLPIQKKKDETNENFVRKIVEEKNKSNLKGKNYTKIESFFFFLNHINKDVPLSPRPLSPKKN